jgi:hypothetical protein
VHILGAAVGAAVWFGFDIDRPLYCAIADRLPQFCVCFEAFIASVFNEVCLGDQVM